MPRTQLFFDQEDRKVILSELLKSSGDDEDNFHDDNKSIETNSINDISESINNILYNENLNLNLSKSQKTN